uniref:Adenylate cyclase n=1 Tax=Tetraselmis sp. GSL018 TaxID=582737 RepID=A0A061SKB1_9CHLO|mmetsp:Transcript_21700/g.51868  ORF Transcript_21700/g.51868 Transcript_21700/m.51868 type:complete len:510 (+) Transcript_21700:178-1707(+)
MGSHVSKATSQTGNLGNQVSGQAGERLEARLVGQERSDSGNNLEAANSHPEAREEAASTQGKTSTSGRRSSLLPELVEVEDIFCPENREAQLGSLFDNVEVPLGYGDQGDMSWWRNRKNAAENALLSETSTGLKPEAICVDDDSVQHVLFRKALSEFYTVSCLFEAEEALSLLSDRYSNGKLDCTQTVLVVDNILPGKSGIEFVSDVRKRFPRAFLPIVVLSGDDADTTAARAFTAGADDFISKPVTPKHLASRVKAKQLSMIRHKSLQEELTQRNFLLQRMLPRPVIENLSAGQQLMYEKKEEVSVVFADIVSFTTIAATMGTDQVIIMLHSLFSAYDELTDWHGVYKAETIGDCYMVVAGHTVQSQRDHGNRAVSMACAMVETAKSLELPNGDPLQIRVGVHTGPAYAGVVGRKMPRYCFFGETVNTANLMESSSFTNCVQVSHATYERYAKDRRVEGDVRDLFVDLGRRSVGAGAPMRTWLMKVGDWQEAVAQLPQGSKHRGREGQ